MIDDFDNFFGMCMPEIRDQLRAAGSADELIKQLAAELDEQGEEYDYSALSKWCDYLEAEQNEEKGKP